LNPFSGVTPLQAFWHFKEIFIDYLGPFLVLSFKAMRTSECQICFSNLPPNSFFQHCHGMSQRGFNSCSADPPWLRVKQDRRKERLREKQGRWLLWPR
jgi:hypothetical protein